MADLPRTIAFAEEHGFPDILVEDIIAYRVRQRSAEQVA